MIVVAFRDGVHEPEASLIGACHAVEVADDRLERSVGLEGKAHVIARSANVAPPDDILSGLGPLVALVAVEVQAVPLLGLELDAAGPADVLQCLAKSCGVAKLGLDPAKG